MTLFCADYYAFEGFSIEESRPACVSLGVCLAQAATHEMDGMEEPDGEEDGYAFLYASARPVEGRVAHKADTLGRLVCVTMSWDAFDQIAATFCADNDLSNFKSAACLGIVLRRRVVSEPLRIVADKILVSSSGALENLLLMGRFGVPPSLYRNKFKARRFAADKGAPDRAI